MENLTLYQRILESNLVNFIIMVAILVLIFKKAKLGVFIDRMAENIQNSVNSSAQAAQIAMAEYKEARKNNRNLPEIKEGIINKAKETSKNMENLAEDALQKEKAALENKFKAQTIADIQKAKDNTANEIYDTVLKLTEEEIQRRLNPETHKNLIEKSIKEIEKLENIKI